MHKCSAFRKRLPSTIYLFISYISLKRSSIVSLSVPIVWLTIYGLVLGAFRGFPKGLDAYAHLTMVKFILDYWPHIIWNYYWYGGLPYYLIYAPFPHILTAGIIKATGWTPEFTIIFLEAISLVVYFIGLFLLYSEVTKNHYAFLLSSLILINSPVFWGLIVVGGAYARIISLMWLPLSSYFVLRWNQKPTKMNYLPAVLITSIGFSSHLQVGLFTVAMAFFLTYFYHSKKKLYYRLKWSMKLLFPVFLLSAYFYIPFILSKPLQFFGKPHLPGPVNIYAVLDPEGWNTIPLYAILFGMLIVILKRFSKCVEVPADKTILITATTKSIKALLLLLFLYAFTSLIPPELYIFSPYDTPFYITLFLSILIGILLTNVKRKIIKFILPSFILLLFLISLLQYPLLQTYVWDSGTKSWYSGYYISQQLVKLPNDEQNFRFGADWDGATSWFNYKYKTPQLLGFYSTDIAPRSDWNHLVVDTVWKEKDELPLTDYLLDWYAIKWLMVGFPYYNYYKYLNRPDSYEVVSKIDTPTMYTMYLFEFKNASPIISTTNAITVAILGDNEYYKDFFLILSLSNYKSNQIIPIHLEVKEADKLELSKFNVILISPEYTQSMSKSSWSSLANFVSKGGALIIDGNGIEMSYPPPSPIKSASISNSIDRWNFTYINENVLAFVTLTLPSSTASFTTKDDIREGGMVILEHNNMPVIVSGQYGAGRVIWLGIDLIRTGWQERSYASSQLMGRLIEWASGQQLREMQILQLYRADNASVKDWRISWTTPNASGEIGFDSNKMALKMEYVFTDVKHDDQVNYLYDPPGMWNFSGQVYFYMRIFGDGSGHKITVYLQSDDYRDSYWFEFYLDWVGWREILYPFSMMKVYGSPNIATINKIEITINDQPDTFGDKKAHSFYIKEISTISYTTPTSLDYSVKRLNPEVVIITLNEPAKGILFKETYNDMWHVSLIINDTKKELKVYPAGPDFMYVVLPDDVRGKAEVVFYYHNPYVFLGFLISALTFVCLFTYYFLGSRLVRIKEFLRVQKHERNY